MPPVDSNVKLRRLEHLGELSRSLARFPDMETLLTSVIEIACDQCECEFAAILLFEQETETLKYVAGPLAYREGIKRLRVPIEASVDGIVYKTSKPLVIPNAISDPRLYREAEQELKLTVYNLAIVPLVFKSQTIGVFEAANKLAMLDFTPDDLQVLETLAAQVALVTLSNLLLEEVQHAYDEVQTLDQLKSNFIAIASHELRTPLGLVIGHASMLQEIITDEFQLSQLEVIIRAANRLKSIMEDLANVNNFQAGTTSLRHNFISINELVQKTLASYGPSAQRKGISLTSRMLEHELVVDADEEKIAIALNNIVANALTFTDGGGHVVISAERLPGYIQVSIADDGIGIPVKDLPHVFDRFFQVQSHLTRQHGGMGLGLTVAKAMVELHKGQIWAESLEGRGSKFTFLLPTQPIGQPSKHVPAFDFS